MGLYRALYQNGDKKGEGEIPADTAVLELWLDDCQNEYEVLIARLRFLDEVLVKHKRKKSYLLQPRVK